MVKAIISIIFGAISFYLSMTKGILGLYFAIPGVIFSILSLKSPVKEITLLTEGYKAEIGGKETVNIKPYVTNRYFAITGLGLNLLSILTFITLSSIPLITAYFTDTLLKSTNLIKK